MVIKEYFRHKNWKLELWYVSSKKVVSGSEYVCKW